jgi:cell division protein DivIC
MLKSLKNNYFLLISTFLVLYFFFNLMSGERGLISYFEKKKILQNLKEKEFQLSYKIEELDLKNSLLSDNLDLDYIETLIRQRFLFGKKDEKIYVIRNYDTKN